jgi:hypothetical protein
MEEEYFDMLHWSQIFDLFPLHLLTTYIYKNTYTTGIFLENI